MKRDRYYGQFQVHDEQYASNMRSMGLTAKLLGSLGRKEMEQVFNGVYYNLDAQVELEYQYQNQDELYHFFDEIGEGAFSNVRRALFLPSGEEMAVKILKSEKETQYVISLVKQEAELLNKLNHPNIVKVKHLIQLNGKFYMGMDLLAGGSLHALIKER